MGDGQALKEHMVPDMLLWSVFEKYTQKNVEAEEVECLTWGTPLSDQARDQVLLSSLHIILPNMIGEYLRKAQPSPHKESQVPLYYQPN